MICTLIAQCMIEKENGIKNTVCWLLNIEKDHIKHKGPIMYLWACTMIVDCCAKETGEKSESKHNKRYWMILLFL